MRSAPRRDPHRRARKNTSKIPEVKSLSEKVSNQSRGLLAQRIGKTFEELLKMQCRRRGLGFKKIPSGCHYARIRGYLRLVPEKTPFDFIICKNLRSATIDCKTFEHDKLRYSDCIPHQVAGLADMGEHIPAGYVVWFRTTDRVVFFNHEKLQYLQARGSLEQSDGLYLGTGEDFDPEKILSFPVRNMIQGTLSGV